MKFLLILNEVAPKEKTDWYEALDKLVKDERLLSSYQVYSYIARLHAGLSNAEILREIIDLADQYQPDAILWAHTKLIYVEKDTLDRLRRLPSRPTIGYWDGDIWQSPLLAPAQTIRLASNSDVVFCQGIGDFSTTVKKKGCTDIRYVPATADEGRFYKIRPKQQPILYDVVMIGNNVTSLLPWRTAPGSRWRKEIARKLHRELGPRFAIYGEGWPASFGKGPIRFHKQVELYHSSRLTIGINNWMGSKYYFSNRLPIAMSSGIPILYNFEEGFSELFPEQSGVTLFHSVQEAVDKCFDLLNKPQAELDLLGAKSFEYSKKHFLKVCIIRYMMQVFLDYRQAYHKKTEISVRSNPWIIPPRL